MKAPTKAQLAADLARALKMVARLTKACDLARDDVNKARDSLGVSGARVATVRVERDQALVERDTARHNAEAASHNAETYLAERDQARGERRTARISAVEAADERGQARVERDQALADLATVRECLDKACVERDRYLANVETMKAERDYLQEGMDTVREIIVNQSKVISSQLRQHTDARARLGVAQMLAAAGQTDLLLRSLES